MIIIIKNIILVLFIQVKKEKETILMKIVIYMKVKILSKKLRIKHSKIKTKIKNLLIIKRIKRKIKRKIKRMEKENIQKMTRII